MSSLLTEDKLTDINSIWMRNASNGQVRSYLNWATNCDLIHQFLSQSQVDSKKLQKAEDKIKQKQDRRAAGDKPALSLSHILANQECQASAAQVISKKESRAKEGGKITDIKIENFDVAFGDKVLIQGATISLAFGRRYGTSMT